MNYRINENLCQAKLSIIRRISDLALENKQPDERVVLFSSGQPADEAMPVELVKEYTAKVIDEYGCDVIQYGGHKGYPKLFPVGNNLGGGVVNTDRGMRRLPYPQSEYNTNLTNVNAAVGMLGGADNAGTDLWWAKKN